MEEVIKIPSIIELFSGPFGCGKTTSLINKYKEVRGAENKHKFFFVIDSLCEYMSRESRKANNEEIRFLPFSSAFNSILDERRQGIYFIDNVELFISSEGLHAFEKILANTCELYMSSLNEKMLKIMISSSEPNMSRAITEMELSTIKYLKSIPNIKVNEMLMQDNKSLPSDYAKQIKKIYGIHENEEL